MFHDDSTGAWDLKSVAPKGQLEQRRKLRENLDAWDGSVGSASLYNSLNSLLLAGHHRFALYCPLNLIPESSWYRKHNESVDLFSELFLTSWEKLLSHHDVLSNFTNGDVPDPRRVVKAAQLAPILQTKGLISSRRVAALRQSEDRVVRESFLPPEEPIEIASGPKRQEWLAKEKHWAELNRQGIELGERILGGSNDLSGYESEAKIKGIGYAIERCVALAWEGESGPDPQKTFFKFKGILLESFGFLDTHYLATSKMLCRLSSMGVIHPDKLREWGVFIPNLSGPFHQNMVALKPTQIRLEGLLEDDDILPVAILFGSKLKGYGDKDSDADIAVFVKPGIVKDQPRVTQKLKAKFGQDVMTYWLKEDGDELTIHNFQTPHPQLGENTDAHILFGGAYHGDLSTIQMLGDKLLKPYFYNKDKNARRVWLAEMERDFLQFRLLHRGYEAYHTPKQDDVFWDDGYRMIASKLYASRVFMPQVD